MRWVARPGWSNPNLRGGLRDNAPVMRLSGNDRKALLNFTGWMDWGYLGRLNLPF
jgi:hypothetical protein